MNERLMRHSSSYQIQHILRINQARKNTIDGRQTTTKQKARTFLDANDCPSVNEAILQNVYQLETDYGGITTTKHSTIKPNTNLVGYSARGIVVQTKPVI